MCFDRKVNIKFNIASYYINVDNETLEKIVAKFTGVSHRLEFVREIDGVKWYNDSASSSPTRTISGLNAFKENIILNEVPDSNVFEYEIKLELDVDSDTFEEESTDAIDFSSCIFENINISAKGNIRLGTEGFKEVSKEFGKKALPIVKCIATTTLQTCVESAVVLGLRTVGIPV